MYVITETWLNNSVYDSEIFESKYVVYRRDRNFNILNRKTEGGGVLIAVSRKYPSYRMSCYESSCDDLWIKVTLCVNDRNEDVCLCAVYMPSPLKQIVLECFVDNANNVLNKEHCTHLIFGDFNIKTIKWVSERDGGSSLRPLSISSISEKTLMNFLLLNDLMQFNYVKNPKDRILDLVLSNSQSVGIVPATDIISRVDPHHPVIQINLSFPKTFTLPYANSINKLSYFKADYKAIGEALNEIDWSVKLNSGFSSVDEMVDIFYEVLHSLIKKFVPFAKKPNLKYPYWFSNQLIRRLSEKNKLRLKYKKYKNPMDEISLHILKKRCDSMAVSCYNSYTAMLETKIKSNPKYFWSYLKLKRGGTSNYPDTMSDGVISSNQADVISNLFASHFASVYETSAGREVLRSESNCYSSNSTLSTITITERQVSKALMSLDLNKGSGPDNIPPVFLSRNASTLSVPISMIFNKSLHSGVFPLAWKNTKIVPVYKSGDKSMVSNYRPIAILSTLAKVFEAIICPILSWHISPLLMNSQHGFVKSRSTATNLTTYAEDLAEAIDARIQVDAVYTDFSKAFDTVHHGILINKLKCCGVVGPLLSWFDSYLSGRNLRVMINGFSSNPYAVTSGIPQGSHLGPHLFILFINDIYECFHNSKIYLFADDLKAIKSIHNLSDSILFQNDLSRLTDWCTRNKMALNIKKCNHVKFTRNINIIPTKYYLMGESIEEVDGIRDLGVFFDKKLSFNKHIDNIIAKASRMLGFVLRECKNFKKPLVKLIMYNSLVRSHLEYCSVVWSPCYKVNSQRIERLQKRFMYHLAYGCNMAGKLNSYANRLNHFGFATLESRRKMHDLVFLKKLVTGIFNCPDLLGRVQFSAPVRPQRKQNGKLFCIPRHKSNLRLHCPLSRMLSTYMENYDSADLVTVPVTALKRLVLSA